MRQIKAVIADHALGCDSKAFGMIRAFEYLNSSFPRFSAKIRDLQPSLLFLQYPYDLLFRKATAFHPSVSFSIGLYFIYGYIFGGHVNALTWEVDVALDA